MPKKSPLPAAAPNTTPRRGRRGGRKPTIVPLPLPALVRDTIPPLLGSEVENLRYTLSGNGKPIPAQDFMFELGLQRTRYTELKLLGDKPILKPRVEILYRFLEEFPQYSYVQDDFLPQTILDLMNRARPERVHTMRDLSIYLGYEMSSHLPWGKGKKMLPTPRRVLRFLYQGLSNPDLAEARSFFDRIEQIVIAVAAGHGLTPPQLSKGGFAGYRDYRRWSHEDAEHESDNGAEEEQQQEAASA